MQRWMIIGAALLCAEVAATPAQAQTTTFRYPKVYGATGRPYGPTQAHYQYLRQYGRPWDGQGGLTATVSDGSVPTFGYVGAVFADPCCIGGPDCFSPPFPGYGYGGIGGPPGFFGHGPMPAPIVIYSYPQLGGPNPLGNAIIEQKRREDERAEQAILDAMLGNDQPSDELPLLPIEPSTPAAQLKSIRAQSHGDMWFKKQEYRTAYSRYRTAVKEAPDRGEAHLRLAVTLATLGHYDRAARQLKIGLQVQPDLPTVGSSLDDLFGPQNNLAKQNVILNVTRWADEDAADPDRKFLLGSLLSLDGDDQRAAKVLRDGKQLAGGGEHFRQFLDFLATDQPAADEEAAAADAGPALIPQGGPPSVPQNPPLPQLGEFVRPDLLP